MRIPPANRYQQLAQLVLRRGGLRPSRDDVPPLLKLAPGLTVSAPGRPGWIAEIEKTLSLCNDVDSAESLNVFAEACTRMYARLAPFLPIYDKLPVFATTSVRQWRYFARKAGLTRKEIDELALAVERGMATANTVTNIEEHFSFDGNTVRKLGGLSSRARTSPRNDELVVELYLSGNVSDVEQQVLQAAFEDLLIETDAELAEAEPPIRGSFFQKLRFIGKVGAYATSLARNLRGAFDAAAQSYDVEAARKLSELLAKHDNVAIRVGSMIAIKVTRARQSNVLIVEVARSNVLAALESDPSLIRDPVRLYELMTAASTVASLADRNQPAERRRGNMGP